MNDMGNVNVFVKEMSILEKMNETYTVMNDIICKIDVLEQKILGDIPEGSDKKTTSPSTSIRWLANESSHIAYNIAQRLERIIDRIG